MDSYESEEKNDEKIELKSKRAKNLIDLKIKRTNDATSFDPQKIKSTYDMEYDITKISEDDELVTWFCKCLKMQWELSNQGLSPFGNYYEFGVGWAGTLTKYLKALDRFCSELNFEPENMNIFCFDSFEGLPESDKLEDKHPTWKKGLFSHSIEEIKQRLSQLDYEINFDKIKFIPGFFETSLNSDLRRSLSKAPPSIVTIDVDYYSSTKTVLKWLRPILKSGTIFYFDDIWSFHGNPNHGQLKAINEFNRKGETLSPFPLLGFPSHSYIYSRKIFEYNDLPQISPKNHIPKISFVELKKPIVRSKRLGSPLGTLSYIYSLHKDLQKAYPEFVNGERRRILQWVISVCDDKIPNETIAKTLLKRFEKDFRNLLKDTRVKQEDDYHKIHKAVKDLTHKLETVDKKNDQLTHKLETVDKKNDQLTHKLETVDKKNDQLTHKLGTVDMENDQLTHKLETVDKENDQLTKKLAQTKQSKEQLEQNLNQLKKKINLQEISQQNDPIQVLLTIYSKRQDLQKKFPEVKYRKLDGLLNWAKAVVLQSFYDNDYDLILPHGPWIIETLMKPKPRIFKEDTKLGEMKKLVNASKQILREEGLGKLVEHSKAKLKRKELHIIEKPAQLSLITELLQPSPTNLINLPFEPSNKKEKPSTKLHETIHKNLIQNFEYKPKISVILPTYNSSKIWLEKATESVLRQQYENWELCIVDDGSTESHVKEVLEGYKILDARISVKYLNRNQGIVGASNEAIKMASGEFITFLDHDDELTSNALYEVVKELNLHKDADVIYSDDAKKDENENVYDYQFKPDWSPELLLSYSYFSHLVVYKKEILDNLGGLRKNCEPSQDYDLMLRATETTNKICHIPKVLYYWRSLKTSTAKSVKTKPHSIEAGRIAVNDALIRRKISGNAIVSEFGKGTNGIYKINFELKNKPQVSIIIPTKDKLDLLEKTIDSIENRITYPNYEIIIVDTGSKQPKTLRYLQKSKHTVLKDKIDKFNFSRANNIAVQKAMGKYVLLMNNDIEVITPTLIDEMVGYLENDEKIGVVGAKLLYPDKRVQHAGVILGLNNGLSGHANKLIADYDLGYMMYSNVARNYSAVTAALCMTRKDLYQKVGEMDEKNLGISYNDVDLCLKMLERGYRTVYNPYALAYHHEGATKGRGEEIDDQREENYFRTKWYELIKKDPYYNPNLSLEDEKFRIKQQNPKGVILFVTHNLNYEGGSISLSLLAKGFKEKDYSVVILSPKDGPLKYFYLSEDIDVFIEPKFFSQPDKAIEFIKNFDLVYVNTIVIYPIVNASKMANVPVIWCIRESEREHYEKEGMDFHQFQNADKVLFVANATKKIFSDLDRNNHFALIPNGLDITKIDSFKIRNSKEKLRKKYHFSNDSIIVTVIGTVTERKGQHIFVESALELCKQNKNMHFLVVGCRDGPYLDKIKNLVKGNLNQIHLIPETSKVYDYYRISDLFICTSYIESFPRIILEAMAFELPIISTNVFGIPEQLIDGIHGILIPPGNSDLLTKKIEYLLNNPNVARKYTKNSYLRAKKEYDINGIVNKNEELFNSVLRKETILVKH